MKVLLLLIPFLFIMGTLNASTDELLGIICQSESSGNKWAVSLDGSDWGLCQVKYYSALKYGGFSKTRSPGDLFNPETNFSVARNILIYCRNKNPKGTIAHLIYCYKAGPNSRLGSNKKKWVISKRVAREYRKVLRSRRKE